MSSTSLWWRHLVNACEVKAHLIGLLAKLDAVCFWQPTPSGLYLVVIDVLRDSLCVVSLLPCVADCCMLYTVCTVKWFVLIILKADYYYIIIISIKMTTTTPPCKST